MAPQEPSTMTGATVIEIRGLTVEGPQGREIIKDLDLDLRAGEVTVLVGESGSGKTTLLNSVLGVMPGGLRIARGEIRMEGVDLLKLQSNENRRYLSRKIGYVPQDVRSALNPLMTALASVEEVARRGGASCRARAKAAMLRSGLSEEFVRCDAGRRPGRLSGGQCQRILIAQAIVNEPSLVLLDEPTASLDPITRRAVQETILRSLDQSRAICLVTHDVASHAGLAHTIGVMYLGRLIEIGPAETVLRDPRHFYTRALWECIPQLDRRRALEAIPGDPPANPAAIAGCKFHPRCIAREDRCRTDEPRLLGAEIGRKVACHVSGA